MLEQRSEEWFKYRAGKFTASDIHRMLGKEGLKKTKDSIDNYAFEKAVESLYGVEEQEGFISKDIERGITLEPLAFRRFKELKEFEFLEVKESTFIPYCNHSGATPDGYVSDNSNLEIKCPRRVKFFKMISKGLEEISNQYYCQMQMQMLCSETEKTYFFNYYIEKGIEYWHEIIVNRNESLIDLIKTRLNQSIEIKLEYIEKINKNIQC